MARCEAIPPGPIVSELLALVAFAFAGSVSPGPNNAVLWASGLRFGFRRTVPHVVGTALGIGVLAVGVAAGIGVLLEAAPAVELVLKLAGSSYLLFVAFLVVGSGAVGRGAVSHPLTLWQAVVFQCVNPKAWIFAVAAVGTFLPPELDRLVEVVVLTGTLMVVVVGSSSIWAAGGAALGRVVDDERKRRAVSVVLAVLLVASVALIWIERPGATGGAHSLEVPSFRSDARPVRFVRA
jgi:threonine/homoserine/homoserine lactone efflux protein